MWFLFQLLQKAEKEISKEEKKQVMIEKAINLKLMCDKGGFEMGGFGMLIEYDEAIELLENVGMVLDDMDAEMDPDFPSKYTCTLNLFRYLAAKDRGMMARKIKRVSKKGFLYDCGNCGFDLNGSPHYKYCPNCGFKIIRAEGERGDTYAKINIQNAIHTIGSLYAKLVAANMEQPDAPDTDIHTSLRDKQANKDGTGKQIHEEGTTNADTAN